MAGWRTNAKDIQRQIEPVRQAMAVSR